MCIYCRLSLHREHGPSSTYCNLKRDNAQVGRHFDIQQLLCNAADAIKNQIVNGGGVKMNASRRSKIIFPLVSIITAFALSAHAEEPKRPPSKAAPAKPGVQAVRPGPGRLGLAPGRGPQDARFARGALPSHHFGGHAYHGRLAWAGGQWRHEMRNGRDGWWWDVGGAWYFYPQAMEGPPAYVSDVAVVDEVAGPDGLPVAAGYSQPPQVYAPALLAYAPPPPPPAPDPAASAIGGAVVGGLLGGLLTGRPSGAVVGAIAGGTTGAIVGAQAAQRPGYYLSQGDCYYRYPSGQYAPVDSRSCD